jgi:hypothetical protein
MIRYNEWLNDSCVDLSLRSLKQEGLSVTVVTSTILGSQKRTDDPPTTSQLNIILEQLRCAEFIQTEGITVLPVNTGNQHWMILLVDWCEEKIVTFDPLQQRSGYGLLSRVVKDYIKKLILPQKFVESRFEEIKQQDAVNCGMFIILFVESYAKNRIKELKGSINNKKTLEETRFKFFKRLMQERSFVVVE